MMLVSLGRNLSIKYRYPLNLALGKKSIGIFYHFRFFHRKKELAYIK